MDITIVDLDTIDISNLNRQFLFRTEHVGKSKAEIAKQVALKFNPKVKITAYHENVKSSLFSIDYMEQFSLVMNALDNVDARKHVNRLCLAAKVPLIESGTTGYLGQVCVIHKGSTECYECTEKATQKVYPICTIRSTPDKMVHCVVWAKECYKLLFGKTEDSMLWEDPENEDKSAFIEYVLRDQDMQYTQESLKSYAHGIFHGLFEFEIKKKLDIKLYQTAAKRPTPILLDELDVQSSAVTTKDATKSWNDRDLWSIDECASRFISCITRMFATEETRANLGNYEFDKDDEVAMEFVTAAANLRAAVFGIANESLYSCKGIAGNIIPAIATTNAIVAGLQVLEAFKVLRQDKPIQETCKYTYCNRMWDSRGVLLNPIALSPPNPKCFVCSRQLLDLAIDVNRTTLGELVDHVLKKRLGMNEPTVSIGINTIYEEGEDAETSLQKNLVKKLCDLPGGGIHQDSTITIEDFSQDFNCTLCVKHMNQDDLLDDNKATTIVPFLLGGEVTKPAQANASLEMDDTGNDSDIEVISTVKSTHSLVESQQTSSKRVKH